jgi:hypothetical protein
MARARISDATREAVRRRAHCRCEYCQIPDEAQVATSHCDHCVPQARGGRTSADNLAWACPRCNGSKLAATEAADPQTGQVVPLFNPRAGRWHDHFEWSRDFLTIVAKTPSARATIERLKMNRPKLRRIRQLMIELGLHPAR